MLTLKDVLFTRTKGGGCCFGRRLPFTKERKVPFVPVLNIWGKLWCPFPGLESLGKLAVFFPHDLGKLGNLKKGNSAKWDAKGWIIEAKYNFYLA